MKQIREISTDVLIIGSGGAGMRAAIEAHDLGADVLVLSKGKFGVSGATVTASADVNADSKSYCEMGLAGDPDDTKEQYFEDTVRGGRFMNDQRLVQAMVDDAPLRVKELIDWKAPVKHVYQTPGHSHARGLWVIGKDYAWTLIRQVRERQIATIDNCQAIALSKDGDRINGAFAVDMATGEYLSIEAKAVILATGGAMSVFNITTAPNELYGEGQIMALEAGAELVDMEFPTFLLGCCMPPAARGINFTYAMLTRASAHMYNKEGLRFLEQWDPERKELTTRDKLLVATANEIQNGLGTPNDGVWVSLGHLSRNQIDYIFESYGKWHGKGADHYECFEIRDLWPNIYEDAIEGAPSAHFWSGGIRIGVNGETSVEGLYAAGEVAGGVHGANRLSGNAMTEILVWGKRTGEAAAKYCRNTAFGAKPDLENSEIFDRAEGLLSEGSGETSTAEFRTRLQKKAGESIGPVRNGETLQSAVEFADDMLKALAAHRCAYKERRFNREWSDALALQRMAKIVRITAETALMREESRGAHYRREFTESKDSWMKNIVVKDHNGEEQLYTKPIEVTSLRPEGQK